MSQNKKHRFGPKQQKVTISLVVVILASYASAVASYEMGEVAGLLPAFVGLLASMYLLSQIMEKSN